MEGSVSVRLAGLIATAAFLVGCGGIQMPATGVAQSAVAQQRSKHLPDTSWMLPEAKNEDLLYVTGYHHFHDVVAVFDYPKGRRVGELRDKSAYLKGECLGQFGNIFVIDYSGKVLEYAHGATKPTRTLLLPGGERPWSCAANLHNGDLAITNHDNGSPYTGYGYNTIMVFKHGHGDPIKYYDPAFQEVDFTGYDKNGNLFVDGNPYAFRLDELPQGSSSLTNLTVTGGILNWPGGVQWADHRLVVGDQECGYGNASCLYQMDIAGSTASIRKRINLSSAIDIIQFWIQDSVVIGPDDETEAGPVWWTLSA